MNTHNLTGVGSRRSRTRHAPRCRLASSEDTDSMSVISKLNPTIETQTLAYRTTRTSRNRVILSSPKRPSPYKHQGITTFPIDHVGLEIQNKYTTKVTNVFPETKLFV